MRDMIECHALDSKNSVIHVNQCGLGWGRGAGSAVASQYIIYNLLSCP